MIKVLIVDDELLVRIGLKSTLNWEENGYIIIGQAKNGTEAIELFKKYDPDIVITDIGMPVMNGLELITYLLQQKKHLKSIILTHHSDFTYAQEAIKLGVSQYILKSELDPDHLLTILNQLSSELIGSTQNQSSQFLDSTNDSPLTPPIEDIKLYFISATSNTLIPKKLATFFSTYFPHPHFNVYIGNGHSSHENTTRSSEFLSYKNIFDNLLQQELPDNMVRYISLIINQQLIILINHNFDSSELLLNYITKFKNNVQKFVNIHLSLGISRNSNSFDTIYTLYHEAILAEEQSFFNESRISIYQQTYTLLPKKDFYYSQHNLSESILNKDIKYLTSQLDHLFNSLLQSKDFYTTKCIFEDLLIIAGQIFKALNQKTSQFISEDKFDSCHFSAFYTFYEMKSYVTNLYMELLNHHTAKYSTQHSFIIQNCIDYIQNHYQDNISLSDISDHLQISKSYLSFLFKQEMGINYSPYINKYRIQQSKELLLQSNYKIYEIAMKVGFDNPYYFSKVFKEFTNMTCKEFRKSCFVNSKEDLS